MKTMLTKSTARVMLINARASSTVVSVAVRRQPVDDINDRTPVASSAGHGDDALRHSNPTPTTGGGCPMAAARHQQSTSTTMPKSAEGSTRMLKSMDKLDGPFGWPIVGNFLTYLKKENQGKMHEVQARQHKQYGKIFREKWGPQWQVHISDPRLIEEVYRHEGRHPFRPALQPWVLYREVTGRPKGLFTSQGPEWYKNRTEFGKRMMNAKAVSRLLDPVNDVTEDLVVKLRHVRDNEGDLALAKRMPREIHNWSMEAAGTFLFETRLGCLEVGVVPERTRKFIAAQQEMLESSLYLIVGERLHHRLNTPFWRRHANSWGQLFDIAKELVDEREKELLKNGEISEDGDKFDGVYLTYLLSNKNVTRDEIYVNVMEFLIAGTDTTANSLCFILHLLANNPEAQERLHQEVSEVLQGRTKITPSELDRMQYVKCVIKEGLRLYPSATMNCRILSEDIVLADHVIPKNTLFVLNHYASARDKDVFVDADRFIPERWHRGSLAPAAAASSSSHAPAPAAGGVGGAIEADAAESDIRQHHAFGCLPFGHGHRSCVGRRAANLEIGVALAKIVQNFKVEVEPGVELNPVLRTLLSPGNELPVRFVERNPLDKSLP